MGYDSTSRHGPRLIEITPTPGAPPSGLHTASPATSEARLPVHGPVAGRDTEHKIVETFSSEPQWRGAGLRPARRDRNDRPREQFLYPEFEPFVTPSYADRGAHRRHPRAPPRLAAASRWATGRSSWSICAISISRSPGSARVLREAYSRARRGHPVTARALPARRQATPRKSLEPTLRWLGACRRRFLAAVIPRRECSPTVPRPPGEAGRTASPAAAGSRAVYRGDKISRKKFDSILPEAGYVAQRRVDPGLVTVETGSGPRAMKFDVRAYAYRDQVLLLGARVYEGQVTNLRSPGGGFSASCVARR
jgi:hypothetical protein